VTVKIKSSKTLKTDSKGQVKVSTKGLAPKKYTAKITFSGNENYLKSSKSVKVTVKKAKPKITAKKKTYKTTTKTKKYTVTLKDNKGKAIKKAKLTLKVKGKTYKAKTNKKGKATFKITKLNKKGTYKATVTYKGNKYFTKASKEAKIKVILTFKTVSKGSKDKNTVKEIQQALKDQGYYTTYKGHYLKVDGKYGKYTVKSIKQFQKDKKLKVTGKVDEKTAEKLKILQ
jgi:peptidoglycan hydrolase-like protein with peptidoglycan-binding domain